jgi:hypothetical protein
MNNPNQKSSTVRLVRRLLDTVRTAGSVRNDQHLVTAWALLGRLAAQGRLPRGGRMQDYLTPQNWLELSDLGLSENFCQDMARQASDAALTARLFSVVTEHLETNPQDWSCPDLLWHMRGTVGHQLGMINALNPDLADHLVKSLFGGIYAKVLLPFEQTGQLLSRLLQRGANVICASENDSDIDFCLMLRLFEEEPLLERIHFLRTSDGRQRVADLRPTHCLCVPPMNVKVPDAAAWRRWESLTTQRELRVKSREMDRSDAWSVATFWPSVTDRAVFLVAPNLIYSQGQEARLREALLFPVNKVSGVINLAPGMSAMTNLAQVALVLNDPAGESIRMIDLTGSVDGRRMDAEPVSKQLELMEAIWESSEDLGTVACDVSLEDVASNDHNLYPPRYTRRYTNLSGPRVRLADLVELIIRPPAAGKSEGDPVWELGISQLDCWAPITGGFARQTNLASRKPHDFLVQTGDVVVSVKGSLGKCGLVGEVDDRPESDVGLTEVANPFLRSKLASNATVVSSSCIALRPKASEVLPAYLLLYMRSKEFARQLEALQVGAAVNHINPNELIKNVMVPILPLQRQRELVDTEYAELVRLEGRVAVLTAGLAQRRSELFAG